MPLLREFSVCRRCRLKLKCGSPRQKARASNRLRPGLLVFPRHPAAARFCNLSPVEFGRKRRAKHGGDQRQKKLSAAKLRKRTQKQERLGDSKPQDHGTTR